MTIIFPWTIIWWNKIDINVHSFSYSVFKSYLLEEIRPKINSLYNIYNSSGIKFLSRLRLGLSHLNEYKFNHTFNDCVNPSCTCTLQYETTSHFFYNCHHYNSLSMILKEDLNSVGKNSDNELTSLTSLIMNY